MEKQQEKVELEDQFILRLPKAEAEYVHKVLQAKPKKLKKVLSLSFDEDMVEATVTVRKKRIKAVLVNLPTIVESCKTLNNVNLYKTATISQMLLCEPGEDREKVLDYPHGIAPPMKNVRKARFRKTTRNQEDAKQAADIQKELCMLLRMDYDAVATRFEIIAGPPVVETPNPITETMLFGALSPSNSDDVSSQSIQ
ncbi:PREDICTED: transcription initiation factor TFIID subunit 7-like [Nicrophorus vespilloides]|uniref:Transcription initiation factor TFIID subunit 7-like n=1 Tax=Nicrophorus vespilloides TaxID=110193 RepID=A0ABM1MIL2_NICVS|nr:PREDICTED: transcription initiation factor TFIID subunit 7-like [Nicrophorus vespilloides]